MLLQRHQVVEVLLITSSVLLRWQQVADQPLLVMLDMMSCGSDVRYVVILSNMNDDVVEVLRRSQ